MLVLRAPRWAGLPDWWELGDSLRLRDDFLRTVGYYDALHHSTISIHSNGGPAISRQRECGVCADEWAYGAGDCAEPELRFGPRCFWRGSQQWFGLFAAVEFHGPKNDWEGLELR